MRKLSSTTRIELLEIRLQQLLKHSKNGKLDEVVQCIYEMITLLKEQLNQFENDLEQTEQSIFLKFSSNASFENQKLGSTAPEVLSGSLQEDLLFAKFYQSLEEEFRGPSETILERQRIYFDFIWPNGLPTAYQPRVLDIGCGRGEWLKFLSDKGVSTVGVDLNEKNPRSIF
jgi:SAM-dependent methyltransferase